MSGDGHWMALALEEARRGLGLTSPNPPVGAVIVRDGILVSRGWHRRAGEPHAEIEALNAAGPDNVRGATVYVTLEPCSTHGRTPPCTEALTKSGVVRVVWGADDPNPSHAGGAAAVLEAAGIFVTCGIRRAECGELIAPFAKFITTGRPYVIAKAGMSIDGKITRPAGEGRWVTGEAARADAMKLRAAADAIIVGAETVRHDDPSLTVRGPGFSPDKTQPWRVVLTNSGNVPPTSILLTDAFRDRTLIVRNQPLADVLKHLAARGVVCALIEGGGRVLAGAFAAGLVDEVVLYTAPLIAGSGRPVVDPDIFTGASVSLQWISAEPIGQDLKLRARVIAAPQVCSPPSGPEKLFP